jgi:hypothetical protein
LHGQEHGPGQQPEAAARRGGENVLGLRGEQVAGQRQDHQGQSQLTADPQGGAGHVREPHQGPQTYGVH